jgi:hypothetical protein
VRRLSRTKLETAEEFPDAGEEYAEQISGRVSRRNRRIQDADGGLSRRRAADSAGSLGLGLEVMI